jgi:hypothetical protein
MPRRLRKQSLLRTPERIVQRNNFLTSAKKHEDVWDQRPSMDKNASASELPSLLSPSTNPLVHYHDPTTAQHIGRGDGIGTGTITGTWERLNDITRHCLASVPLVSSGMPWSTQLSMSIPLHYEQVAPIPPLIQYPIEDRTAWYEAALNINHQQLFHEALFHEDGRPHAPQDQYPPNGNSTLQSVTPQVYNDPGFGIAGVPGREARYTGLPGHGWPNSFMGYSAGPGDIHDGHWDSSMDHADLSTGYSQTPGPYASQANSPIQTAPTTIPIHQHIQYITPAIDTYRPRIVYEGLHIPSNQEFPYHLPPGCDQHIISANYPVDPGPSNSFA